MATVALEAGDKLDSGDPRTGETLFKSQVYAQANGYLRPGTHRQGKTTPAGDTQTERFVATASVKQKIDTSRGGYLAESRIQHLDFGFRAWN